MRTRRDQVQAYRFVTRRIVSALLSGDPETNDLPMRRLGMAVFGSVIVAAVVLGGVGAYGQLTGNAAPLEANTLVIERETGATYVFVDGLLHPTLNYASARLILNEADPQVRTMSQASIEDRPRGRTVGIVGAPDALPDRKSLIGLPWSVCDVPDPADPRRSTHPAGDRPPAARRHAARRPGGAGPDRRQTGTCSPATSQLRLIGGDQALAALKMAGAATVDASGSSCSTPCRPGRRCASRPSTARASPATADGGRPSGHRSVQVFRAAGQHYVLTREGLASIGEVTALLLLGDGGQVTDITPDQAGAAPDRPAAGGRRARRSAARPARGPRGSDRALRHATGPAPPAGRRPPPWRSSTGRRPS